MKRFLVWFLTLSLILTGLATGASAAAGDGWKQAGEEWQYFENGEAVKEKWIQSDGQWYYFDRGGYMVHDRFLYLTEKKETDENGETHTHYYPTYFMQGNGAMLAGGWYHWNDTTWIYANEDGTLPNRWANIDGDWYYFWYGRMRADQIIWPEEGGSTYYAVGKDGKMKTNGWVPREYAYGYWDENDQFIQEGTGTDWYYAGEDGALLKGWQMIDGEWYFFYQKGINEWADQESTPFMFRNDSATINGNYYCFEESGAMVKNRWIDMNSRFNWGNEDPFWVYFKEDGAQQIGWFEYDGRWYHTYESGWTIYNTLAYVGDVRYAFGEDCALVEGWFRDPHSSEETWYYSTENGILVSTWKQIDGVWYYFNEYGEMVHDVKDYVIDGKPYTFDQNGAWVG